MTTIVKTYGLKYWREYKKGTSKNSIKGPAGVGFKLTDDGNYDIQNKRIVNVGNPESKNDAVNLALHDSLKEYVDERLNEREKDIEAIEDDIRAWRSRFTFIAGVDSVKIDKTQGSLKVQLIATSKYIQMSTSKHSIFIFKESGYFEVILSFFSSNNILKQIDCYYDNKILNSVILRGPEQWHKQDTQLLSTHSFLMDALIGKGMTFKLFIPTSYINETEIKDFRLFIRPV